MKVLYVKTNSQRSKAYQIRTIIYEIDGQKYVKKEAVNKESIAHLKQMKLNYEQLQSIITKPNVQLSKIIDESENSLTFEYIDGVNAETVFSNTLQEGAKSTEKFLTDFRDFLQSSFKTKLFKNDSKNIIFKNTFGDADLSNLDDEWCFNGVSNIDLIFSNIIYKNDITYIIDYEWVYNCSVPIDYIIYRALNYQSENIKNYFPADLQIRFYKMESHFIDFLVNDDKSFLKTTHKYQKRKLSITPILKNEKQFYNLQRLINNLRHLKRLILKR